MDLKADLRNKVVGCSFDLFSMKKKKKKKQQ